MRILIVEDEARIRAFLAGAFEAEGFAVDVVEDGENGLERALGGNYVLVILDLLLPGRSGLDVLRELHSVRSELPVLILSARTDLSTKLRGFELGAVDYVAKPFSLDELLARARASASRAADERRSEDPRWRPRTRSGAPPGARWFDGCRAFRPRVPRPALPAATRRRGDQPRAAPGRGLGL